jgi:hypothetical protein
MPARSTESSPGHRVMVFDCDTCGGPASFGEGVNLREALRSGDVSKAGRWFCGIDTATKRFVCIGKGRAGGDLLGRAA